jgi:aspartate ammonia-lyase
MKNENTSFRTERDPLGEVQVPAVALYGVQTKRALENFRISELRIDPLLIIAFAEIKKAAALANMRVEKLEAEKGRAIIQAADEVIAGRRQPRP